MYRGYTDGQYFSDIRYLSTRAQTLPVIDTSTEFEMTDAKLTANIPKGYPHAWVTGKSPNVFLERVTAVSSSPYGAPLVSTRRAPREENFWAMPRHGWIEDCVVSAANSPSDVLIDFKRTPMAILYVHNCREAQGRNIRLLNVGSVPRNYREMLSSGKPGEEEELPEALTHRWLFDGNGPEIDCTVPKIFQKCLEKPIPSQALVGYPDIDLPVSQPTSGPYQVFSGEDYGLGLERSDADETAALQKLVDATAGAHNPLVLLPGRPIRIDGTVRLPRRITVRAVGFAVLVGRNDKDAADFFRVVGENLAIAFEDIGFWYGRRMFDVRGSGHVYIKGATAQGNRGYRLERRGAKLAVDVFATTMIGPQFVENDGADLRVRDSWMQFEASPMTCVCCINRRGTLLFEHICGVPVSKGVVWASRERRKEIPAGEHYFWIRNEGGIVRSRNFRYGGEYGGVSILDNYADGRALLESQIACFVNFSGALSVFRNSDPEGEVVLNRVKFVVDDLNRVKIGRGVRPRVFYRSGDRWEKDHFDR